MPKSLQSLIIYLDITDRQCSPIGGGVRPLLKTLHRLSYSFDKRHMNCHIKYLSIT